MNASLPEGNIAPLIIFLLVRVTIYFNGKGCRMAIEVRDISGDNLLTAEVQSRDAISP